MREQLIQYVELLFAGAPGAEEMKQEILQNTLDRYDDLISQGKSEEAAYRLAISGIGDINELLDSQVRSAPAPEPEAPYVWPIPEQVKKTKSKPLVRIVLITLIILLVGSIALTALGVGIFSVYIRSESITQSNQLLQSDLIYPQDFDANRISNIEIVWAAGEIRIEPVDDLTAIQIRESEVEEKYKMVCKVSGDTLKIQFCKASLKFPSFGVDTVAKDLVITVPADWVCRELDIDAAAANVTIQNMTIGELDFDGASGICDLENCRVTSMDVDAASGNLTFSGILDNLDFDGASADCTLVLDQCPKRIELDGMSGKMDITLPSDCGFTVNAEGLSSDFSTDFKSTARNGAHVHGDGSCQIRLEALSGDLTIHDGGYPCRDEHQGHH